MIVFQNVAFEEYLQVSPLYSQITQIGIMVTPPSSLARISAASVKRFSKEAENIVLGRAASHQLRSIARLKFLALNIKRNKATAGNREDEHNDKESQGTSYVHKETIC